MQVTPYAMDPAHESLTVNGRRQPSGTTSREIFVGAGYGNGAEYTLGNGTVAVTCWAEDRVTARTYRVALTREPAPIAPTDATLRELRVAPTRTARLVLGNCAGDVGVRTLRPGTRDPVGDGDADRERRHAYRVAVNGVDVGSGGAATTSMSVLLAREDVTLRVEVYARSCDPNWEGFGRDVERATRDLVAPGVRPGCVRGLAAFRAGDQEDPTGIVREMRPFPSPFRGDADGFVESMEQRAGGGVRPRAGRSTGAEGLR